MNNDEDWRQRAACATAPPEYFEYSRKSGAQLMLINAGLSYCDICPVTRECWQSASVEDRHNTVRGGRKPRAMLINERDARAEDLIEAMFARGSCVNGHVFESRDDLRVTVAGTKSDGSARSVARCVTCLRDAWNRRDARLKSAKMGA